MTQARITVRDEALSRAERILKITKLGSLTELFNVLVTRYGNHLEATWIIPANSCLCSATSAPQTTTLFLDAIRTYALTEN
jgi:hypothetical protein